MSEGLQVAKLFARIGFNISEGDLQNVVQNLQKIEDKLNDLIQKAADFATNISLLSKGTNLSPEFLQKFEKLGIDANIGAEAMKEFAMASAQLSNQAFWGKTNVLSQWGVDLKRADDAATVFFKVMQGAAGKSFQMQSEMFSAAGFPLAQARKLLDHIGKHGFSSRNAFAIDSKTIKDLEDIKVVSEDIKWNFEQFERAFVGQQSGAIKSTLKDTQKIYDQVQKLILEVTGSDIFKTTFGVFYKAMPAVNTVLDNFGTITKAFTGKLNIIKSIFTTIKTIIGASILFKIVSILSGGTGFNILSTLDRVWDKILKNSSAARQLQELVRNAFIKGYGILEKSVGKGLLKRLGIEKLKDDLLDKGLFKVLDEKLSQLWKKLGEIVNSLMRFLKEFTGWLWDLATNRIDYFLTQLLMYSRLAAIEMLQQVRESAVGSRLSFFVGKPESREVVEWRKRNVLAEGLGKLMDVERKYMNIVSDSPIKQVVERTGEAIEDFFENKPPSKPIIENTDRQPEVGETGPGEGYEPMIVNAATGEVIEKGSDEFKRYEPSVPEQSRRPVQMLVSGVGFSGAPNREIQGAGAMQSINLNQNNNIYVNPDQVGRVTSSLGEQVIKQGAAKAVNSQNNRGR